MTIPRRLDCMTRAASLPYALFAIRVALKQVKTACFPVPGTVSERLSRGDC